MLAVLIYDGGIPVRKIDIIKTNGGPWRANGDSFKNNSAIFFSLFIEALFRVGLKNNVTGQNKAFWSIC
jgi:hypothetical protein